MKTEIGGPEAFSVAWAVADKSMPLLKAALRGELPEAVARSRAASAVRASSGFDLLDGGVAILYLTGFMVKNPTFLGRYFPEIATSELVRTVTTAADDPRVKGIVLDVDSPGGMVDGTEALANAIYLARTKKPVVAVIDGTGASAAYWAASAASNVYITARTTEVGSIGVVAMHIDFSGAEKQRGVVISEITAGKHKRIASEHAPLTPEGRDSIQSFVDSIYSVFVADVAKHRGVPIETAKRNMADGRLFIGTDAIKAGLVDGIKTLDQVVTELGAAVTKAKSVANSKPLSANDAYTAELSRLQASGVWGEKAMRQALASPVYLEAKAREEAAKKPIALPPVPVAAPQPVLKPADPITTAREIAAEADELERLLAKAGFKLSPSEACALVAASRSSVRPNPRQIAYLAAIEEQRIKEQAGLPITSEQAVARVSAKFKQ